ncbi:transposable element Tc1 transposase [Trichonephila clavipes]|nr:transposable element Tc1 transposase [Trichonephila clavipes]
MPIHCQARLQWCLARSGWNQADWGHIVFSDESCFQLCPDDHRRRVWRRPGQCADPAFTIACHTGPQLGVIVWGAVSFDSQTPLVVIRPLLQHSECISGPAASQPLDVLKFCCAGRFEVSFESSCNDAAITRNISCSEN